MNNNVDDYRKLNDVPFIEWDDLEDKTIFITGATGLIGAKIVNVLNYIKQQRRLKFRIVALVRNEKRAKERFKNIDEDILEYVVGSIEQIPEIKGSIDYIIHGASQTASREFVEHAVETIETSVYGTQNILKLAKEKKIKSFVYLSSMEVYGLQKRGYHIVEKDIGSFSPLILRNSYPISKIMCESMCCAYSKEYGVPAKIVRLAQTFGSDVNYNDKRVFAYFEQCVKEKKNIILKTTGETERCYLNSLDAVTAIFTVLLNGINATAYNVADENTYCSIAEMAEKIANEGGVEVVYDIQPLDSNGFPEPTYMFLDTNALRNLGWKPLCEW